MIIIWIISILAILIMIAVLMNILKNWNSLMNYKNLFSFLIIGTIILSVFFYFIQVDNNIKAITYILHIIASLFYGAFKTKKT